MSSLSPPRPKKAKPTGSKSSHNCKYNKEWESKHPFLKPSTKKGENYAYCSYCKCDFSVSHGAMNDVKNHIKTKKHSVNHKVVVQSSKISSYFPVRNHVWKGKCKVYTLLSPLLFLQIKQTKHNINMYSMGMVYSFINIDSCQWTCPCQSKPPSYLKIIQFQFSERWTEHLISYLYHASLHSTFNISYQHHSLSFTPAAAGQAHSGINNWAEWLILPCQKPCIMSYD